MDEYARLLRYAFIGLLVIAGLFGLGLLATPSFGRERRSSLRRMYGLVLIAAAIAGWFFFGETVLKAIEQLSE